MTLRRVPFTYPKHPLPHRIHRRERRSILFIAQRQLQQRPAQTGATAPAAETPSRTPSTVYTPPVVSASSCFALLFLSLAASFNPRVRRHPSRSFHRARDQLLRGATRSATARTLPAGCARLVVAAHRFVRSRVRVFVLASALARFLARVPRRRSRVVARVAAATARARRRRRRRRASRSRRPRSSRQRAGDRARRRHRDQASPSTRRGRADAVDAAPSRANESARRRPT